MSLKQDQNNTFPTQNFKSKFIVFLSITILIFIWHETSTQLNR